MYRCVAAINTASFDNILDQILLIRDPSETKAGITGKKLRKVTTTKRRHFLRILTKSIVLPILDELVEQLLLRRILRVDKQFHASPDVGAIMLE